MNLEQRTDALLDLVERYRTRRTAELLEPAMAEARETLRSARSEARRRVTTAIAEERKRMALEVGAVEAALATDRRLTTQRHAVKLLTDAWRDVRARLEARWDDPSARTRWTEWHLQRALRAVPPAAGWLIQFHRAWSEPERTRALQWLSAHGVSEVRFEEDTSIKAGFRIIGGHNVLDATVEGLLADRAQLQGRLLHYLQQGASA
jgi:hypothetical protein